MSALTEELAARFRQVLAEHDQGGLGGVDVAYALASEALGQEQTDLAEKGDSFSDLDCLRLGLCSIVEDPCHPNCGVEIHSIVVANCALEVGLGLELACARGPRNRRCVVCSTYPDVIGDSRAKVREPDLSNPQRNVAEISRLRYYGLRCNQSTPLVKFLAEILLEVFQRGRDISRRLLSRASLPFSPFRIQPREVADQKPKGTQRQSRPNMPFLGPPSLRKHNHADESSANLNGVSGTRGEAQ